MNRSLKVFFYSALLPFFMALIPLLDLYSLNIDEVLISDFIATLCIFLSLFFLIFVFLIFVFKSYKKASFFLFIIYFSSYLILKFYRYFYINNSFYLTSIIRARFVFIFCLLLFFTLFFILLKLKTDIELSILKYLNLIFFLITISFFYKLIVANIEYIHEVNDYTKKNVLFRNKLKEAASFDFNKKVLPDIYYIILDTHPSFGVLKKYFNYDADIFYNKLKDLGFDVVLDSKSSYDHTYHSIPSTLNMNYLAKNSIASYLLKNNNVKYFLDYLGYNFINIPSSWGPVKKLGNSKFYNLINEFFQAFLEILFKNTKWRYFPDYYFGLQKYSSIFSQLEFFLKNINNKSPKFVLAHFLCPHGPVVFDRDGKFSFYLKHNKRQYLDQMIFFDEKIISVIQSIIDNSKINPIIILQSDHGPGLFWDNADLSEVPFDLRFEHLNAFYMPTLKNKISTDKFSAVNTFRIVFNHLFNLDLDLLEYKYFNYC